MAERGGFEPPIHLHVCRISSAVRSTTLPPLREVLMLRRFCLLKKSKRLGRGRSIANCNVPANTFPKELTWKAKLLEAPAMSPVLTMKHKTSTAFAVCFDSTTTKTSKTLKKTA